jgi:uncharacterized metal-binding protein YceD (DUF177 family)
VTSPEFSRPQRLDRIGAGEAEVAVSADAGEREALARRFGLIAIGRLEARFALRRAADSIRARGHLAAEVTQACVASGDPVPARIEEDFELRFVEEPAGGANEEVELSEEECDTVFYTGGALDLGEAAAETLALALDPFPRSARAAEVLRAAGVLSEEEAGPFGALAGLKARLEGKE